MPAATALVVPCFNEARRLDRAALTTLTDARPGLVLWLVDDGSTDGTATLLARVRDDDPERIRVLTLPRNQGKGEAVRAGLRGALAEGAALVGYLDADFSTPPEEALMLFDVAEASDARVVMAARVQLLGRRIERRAHRHYLGRVFATAASIVLRLPVYDTQCGAKLLRASPALDRALARPFLSRWAFDVELLARLCQGGYGVAPLHAGDFVEVPLRAWRDVGGSSLGMSGMLRAGADLLRLWVRLRLAKASV
jgi:glycosyltransferase involved in cell wall biosynthesis